MSWFQIVTNSFFFPSCCFLLLCSSCRSNTKSLLLAQIGKPNSRFEKPLSLIRGFCKTTIRPPSSSSFGEQARDLISLRIQNAQKSNDRKKQEKRGGVGISEAAKSLV